MIGASGCIKTKSGVSRCWQADNSGGVVGAGVSAAGAGWRGGCLRVPGASRGESVAARLSRISAVAMAAIAARADMTVRIPRCAIKGVDLLLPPKMADHIFYMEEGEGGRRDARSPRVTGERGWAPGKNQRGQRLNRTV